MTMLDAQNVCKLLNIKLCSFTKWREKRPDFPAAEAKFFTDASDRRVDCWDEAKVRRWIAEQQAQKGHLLTSAEVCQVIGIEQDNFSIFRQSLADFPKSQGCYATLGGRRRSHHFIATEVHAWVKQQQKDAEDLITSVEVCEMLSLTFNNFTYFRNRRPGFPKPVGAKPAMGKGRPILHFERAAVDAWLKTADWDWTDGGLEEKDAIRYTTPQMRERVSPPPTLLFCFVAGAFAPRRTDEHTNR